MEAPNDIVRLLVGVCVTKQDWITNHRSLYASFSNIAKQWENKVLFYVVLQGVSNEEHVDCLNIDTKLNIDILKTTFMGVSRARNICIEKAKYVNSEFILFHDASIYWTPPAAEFIAQYRNDTLVTKVKVSFSAMTEEGNATLGQSSSHSIVRKINPFYDAYVWSYLFRVAKLQDIIFDERFGPGQDTRFKSGEDVSFLFDYFSTIKTFSVLEATNAFVCHPPRTADFDKHLIYASGQGKTFKVLMKKYPSWKIYVDLGLFFGNALYRCLLLKPNAFEILRQRLIGFFDRGVK
jgi:hypothetical protein